MPSPWCSTSRCSSRRGGGTRREEAGAICGRGGRRAVVVVEGAAVEEVGEAQAFESLAGRRIAHPPQREHAADLVITYHDRVDPCPAPIGRSHHGLGCVP